MTFKKISKTFIATVICAAAFSAPAFAGGGNIEYTTESLATPDGVVALYAKLEKRTSKACAKPTRARMHDIKIERMCKARTLEKLVEMVNHPNVTAHHAKLTKKK